MNLQITKKELNSKYELIFNKLGMKYEVFGDNVYSTCPVHNNSDNPRAFSFSLDKGIWKCWTRDCQHQYRNDIIGLIRGALSNIEGEDIGFSKALRWACELIKIKHDHIIQDTAINDSDEFSKLVASLKESNDVIEYSPIVMEDLTYPSKYFINRGFLPETLQYFGVGDCANPKSKMFDRSVIPIHDDSGKNIVAIIGRSIKEYKSPKFLFYPKGFVKTGLLYNYHRAVDKVNETKCIFIVEGQGDVWKLHEAGITNVMSIFGKSISKDQEIKLNKLHLTHVIVLTDNDQAGRESKMQIQRQLNRTYKLSFPKIPTKDVGEMTVEQIKNTIFPQLGIKYL